jgi:hypothetical protein
MYCKRCGDECYDHAELCQRCEAIANERVKSRTELHNMKNKSIRTTQKPVKAIIILVICIAISVAFIFIGALINPSSHLATSNTQKNSNVSGTDSKVYEQIKNTQYAIEKSPLHSDAKSIDFLDYISLNSDVSFLAQEKQSIDKLDQYRVVEYPGSTTIDGGLRYIKKGTLYFHLEDVDNVDKQISLSQDVYSVDQNYITYIGFLNDQDVFRKMMGIKYPRLMEIGKQYTENSISEASVKDIIIPKGFVDLEVSDHLFKDCLVIEQDSGWKLTGNETGDFSQIEKDYYAKGVGIVYTEVNAQANTTNKQGQKKIQNYITKEFFLKFKNPPSSPVATNDNNTVNKTYPISADEAMKKVQVIALNKWKKAYVEYYSSEQIDTSEYYLVVVNDRDSNQTHLFDVDKETGKVYEKDTNNHLNPVTTDSTPSTNSINSSATGSTNSSSINQSLTPSTGAVSKPPKVITKEIKVEYNPSVPGTPQQVQFYIQDMNHTIDKPVETMDITQDLDKQIQLTLQDGIQGEYKIVRDGSITIDDFVNYNDSN